MSGLFSENAINQETFLPDKDVFVENLQRWRRQHLITF